MNKITLLILSINVLCSCNPLSKRDSIVDSEFASGGFSSNTAPVVSSISDQDILENTSSSLLPLTISDSEQALNCNTSITMSSSNTTLINDNDVVIGGTVPNCTLSLTPNSNETGSSTIAVSVTDGALTSIVTFDLNVSFNPKVVTHLELWLDASESASVFQDSTCLSASVLDSDPVGCWKDLSLNGNDATMSTPSQAPLLDLTTNNASISFDGIDDFFDDTRSYTARTVFIVYRIDSSLQSSSDLAQLWGQYTEGHVAIDARSAGLWSFDGNASEQASYSIGGATYSGPSVGSSAQPWTSNQFDIIKSKFVNDLPITRQVLGSLFPSFSVGTHQFGGQISEVLVYSRNLTTIEEQRIEGYLACKWTLQGSLPITHPFKVSCP